MFTLMLHLFGISLFAQMPNEFRSMRTCVTLHLIIPLHLIILLKKSSRNIIKLLNFNYILIIFLFNLCFKTKFLSIRHDIKSLHVNKTTFKFSKWTNEFSFVIMSWNLFCLLKKEGAPFSNNREISSCLLKTAIWMSLLTCGNFITFGLRQLPFDREYYVESICRLLKHSVEGYFINQVV